MRNILKFEEKILLILSGIFFLINIIYQEFYYEEYSKLTNQNNNNIMIRNSEKLSDEELISNGAYQLEMLKDTYFNMNMLEEAQKIIEIQINNGYEVTLDVLIDLINISERRLDFESSKKYIEKGFDLMNNKEKSVYYMRLGEYELIDHNIQNAIEYTKKAKKIYEINKDDIKYESDIKFVENRLDLFMLIENEKSDTNPFDMYKLIIESEDIIYSPYVCKALIEKYEKEYGNIYKDNIIELKNIYNKFYF